MTRLVLLADDEPMIRESVSRVLEARGHQVDAVGVAGEAQASIRRRLPDVAIVDWKMPGGGEAVVRELLDSPDFRGNVIVISGAPEEELPASFMDRGVTRLRKPFSFPNLVALVEAVTDPD